MKIIPYWNKNDNLKVKSDKQKKKNESYQGKPLQIKISKQGKLITRKGLEMEGSDFFWRRQ